MEKGREGEDKGEGAGENGGGGVEGEGGGRRASCKTLGKITTTGCGDLQQGDLF